MTIEKVGVLGCGLMGSGIAEVCAKAGLATVVREVEQGLLDAGLARIGASMEKAVSKGRLGAEERDAALGRLEGTTDLSDLADCDLVIEAIIENLDEKRKVYAVLEEAVQKEAIFASNTLDENIQPTDALLRSTRKDLFETIFPLFAE